MAVSIENEIIQELNEILKDFKEVLIEDVLKLSIKNPHYIFIKDNNKTFYLEDKNKIYRYNNVVQDCWQDLDAKIIDKIYFGYYRKIFDELICEKILKKENLINRDIENLYKKFENIQTESYTMIIKLYGLCLVGKNKHINLGKFVICDYEYFIRNYNGFNNINHAFYEKPKGMINNCYLIHNNIIAIDNKKAEFVFFDKINKFINIILFCCRYSSEDNAKISYKDNNSIIEYICANNTNNNLLYNSKNDSLINPLYNLPEDCFGKNNYTFLFEYLDRNNLNILEKKVSIAIDWIGQSLRTNNLQQRYTFVSIALETLLSKKSSGIMDYGVTYRLREYAAFLASEDIKKREEIFNILPKLYGKRSEISHNGHSKDLKLKDYYTLLNIVFMVTIKYCKLIKEGKIKNIKDLDNYINEIKGLKQIDV